MLRQKAAPKSELKAEEECLLSLSFKQCTFLWEHKSNLRNISLVLGTQREKEKPYKIACFI